jgi:predicted ATPase/DNA-binding SARP family transcriptional activator/DNA-binding CsgD family transcriptional regulator
MTAVHFAILGPVEVTAGGQRLGVGGPRARAVLARLIVAANHVVAAEPLAGELWPDLEPGRAAANLQVQLAGLRRVFRQAGAADRLVTRAPGYALVAGPDEVDATRFDQLAAQGRALLAAGDAVGAGGYLARALGLWRGPPLADIGDWAWAQAEAARLGEARMAAVECHVQARLDCGDSSELIGELEALTAEHRLRERLWALRMLALYRSGRQAEALGAYQHLRTILVEELGIEPAIELRELHQQILAQDPGLAVSPPAQATGMRGFPAALTSFVGRAAEVAELAELLGEFRLVTVTGPGGIGKTRLASEAARRMTGRFADGVYLVELASVQDPALVVVVVSAALGVSQAPGTSPMDSLAAVMSGRQLLLVLDNCEHLLAAVAELCAALLPVADDIRVLATSREPVGVAGEARFRLGPLGLPMQDSGVAVAVSEAAVLFAERGRQADHRFQLDTESAPAVARVVHRLDGMPLAIELAAARVGALGVTQLADLLDNPLGTADGDWLGLLAGSDWTAPGRHRSLAATAEWSYQLLGEPERSVFRTLAVFPGPFTLEAAEEVAGPGAGRAVLRLVDCSLLAPPQSGPDARARYLMLETLRGYAGRQLAQAGEDAAAKAALAGYALRVAERAAAGLETSVTELAAAAGLDAEDATVHRALAWALGHDPAAAQRLAVALAPWWMLRGRYTAGYELLSAACRDVALGSEQWCTAQVWLGRLAIGTDEAAGLKHFAAARDALAASAPTRLLVQALAGCADCLLNLGRVSDAAAEAERALNLATDMGYLEGQARALCWLGASAYYAGDHAACLTWWRQAQRIDAAAIPGALVRRSTFFLAIALADAGELAEARQNCARVLSLARQAGALFDQADSLILIANIDLLTGTLPEARAHLCEAMELVTRIGNDLLVHDCLDACGHLCAETRRYGQAMTVWAADAALRAESGIPDPPRDAQRREKPLRKARQALGSQRADAAQARGAAMTLPIAAEYAALAAADGVGEADEAPGIPRLSAREEELVTLVAQGRTDTQIARQLSISIRTVRSHLDRIRDKTGCRRRADLTRLALQTHLV